VATQAPVFVGLASSAKANAVSSDRGGVCDSRGELSPSADNTHQNGVCQIIFAGFSNQPYISGISPKIPKLEKRFPRKRATSAP
jgi:hypothetical protein